MPIEWPEKPTAEETLQEWIESFKGIELHSFNTRDPGFFVTKDHTDSSNRYECAVLMYYGGGVESTKKKLESVASHLDDLGIHYRGDYNSYGYPQLYVFTRGLLEAERSLRFRTEVDEAQREAAQILQADTPAERDASEA